MTKFNIALPVEDTQGLFRHLSGYGTLGPDHFHFGTHLAGDVGRSAGPEILTSTIALTDPPPMTSAEIFHDQGELAFLATLAKAAYNLLPDEPVSDATNDPGGPTALAAYQIAEDNLALLTAADLPSLQPTTGAAPFTFKGIEDAIYVNQNAAALIGRSSDALFVAFRGTNDNGPGNLSPDQGQWLSQASHFALFGDLVAALGDYVAANPDITKLFVTGHSLGAAMVQPFIAAAESFGLTIEAATFATPGYGLLAPDHADSRITNLWTDDDIIQLAAAVSGVDGDQNQLVDGIFDTTLPNTSSHSMNLYLAIARFLNAEGVELADLQSLNGINYDSIVMKVRGSDPDFNVGTGKDKLAGTGSADLMLGGPRSDKLNGHDGRDTLLGGAGRDTLIGGNQGDFLNGGAKADVFVFKQLADSVVGSQRDVIQDFSHAQGDLIDLSGIDAKQGSGNQAFDWIGKDKFDDHKGELHYVQKNGYLRVEGDTAGNGKANFQIELDGPHNLVADDFVL